VTDLTNQIAELFEPITGVSRVGYDCQLGDECWIVAVYLGATEMIGGSEDGKIRYANFEIDLREVLTKFDEYDEFIWSSFPLPMDGPESLARSFVTIAGKIGGNPIRLQLFSVPPEDAGPGMRHYPDGRFETY
jgi:hypothetical protein